MRRETSRTGIRRSRVWSVDGRSRPRARSVACLGWPRGDKPRGARHAVSDPDRRTRRCDALRRHRARTSWRRFRMLEQWVSGCSPRVCGIRSPSPACWRDLPTTGVKCVGRRPREKLPTLYAALGAKTTMTSRTSGARRSRLVVPAQARRHRGRQRHVLSQGERARRGLTIRWAKLDRARSGAVLKKAAADTLTWSEDEHSPRGGGGAGVLRAGRQDRRRERQRPRSASRRRRSRSPRRSPRCPATPQIVARDHCTS